MTTTKAVWGAAVVLMLCLGGGLQAQAQWKRPWFVERLTNRLTDEPLDLVTLTNEAVKTDLAPMTLKVFCDTTFSGVDLLLPRPAREESNTGLFERPNQLTINLRWDNGAAEGSKWHFNEWPPVYNYSVGVYDEKKFIARLRTASRLRILYTAYNSRNILAEFDVSGFSAAKAGIPCGKAR